jgi:FAD dependent oxidoreductase
MRMAEEAKARLLLHAWCTAPIIEDGIVRGAIFESKEGRHAILAKVVVDTTGDADLISRSGARCESDVDASDIHHCMNTVFLLGGVDMERWLAFRREEPDLFAAFTSATTSQCHGRQPSAAPNRRRLRRRDFPSRRAAVPGSRPSAVAP